MAEEKNQQQQKIVRIATKAREKGGSLSPSRYLKESALVVKNFEDLSKIVPRGINYMTSQVKVVSQKGREYNALKEGREIAYINNGVHKEYEYKSSFREQGYTPQDAQTVYGKEFLCISAAAKPQASGRYKMRPKDNAHIVEQQHEKLLSKNSEYDERFSPRSKEKNILFQNIDQLPPACTALHYNAQQLKSRNADTYRGSPLKLIRQTNFAQWHERKVSPPLSYARNAKTDNSLYKSDYSLKKSQTTDDENQNQSDQKSFYDEPLSARQFNFWNKQKDLYDTFSVFGGYSPSSLRQISNRTQQSNFGDKDSQNISQQDRITILKQRSLKQL